LSRNNKTIYLNGRFLTQPITGVQRYAIELYKELIKLDIDIQIIAPSNVIHLDLVKKFNVKIIGKNKGHLWEQIDLPKFLKSYNSPYLVNLCNTAPLFYSYNIVTLHDLAFIKHPEWFSFSFKRFYQFLIPRIVRSSKLIFTVSETMKRDITQHFGKNLTNIYVTYNGISDTFKKPLKRKNNFEKPFFLAMGGRNPRKNLTNVLKAMHLLNRSDYDLRIIGRAETNFNNSNLNIDDYNFKVIYHTDISDDYLKSLYQEAQALLYPSFYEGFGLPPLEALNSNCPIIISDIDVFNELFKKFALFVDPHKPEDIKMKMIQVIEREQIVISESSLLELNNKYSYKNAALIVYNQLSSIN
jgi:glycosyltransferase involved in cell wall biosynthesis